LIRDVDDHGVIIIGDPRLTSKPYGRVFKRSLPPMPIVTDVTYVENSIEDKIKEQHDEPETVSA